MSIPTIVPMPMGSAKNMVLFDPPSIAAAMNGCMNVATPLKDFRNSLNITRLACGFLITSSMPTIGFFFSSEYVILSLTVDIPRSIVDVPTTPQSMAAIK